MNWILPEEVLDSWLSTAMEMIETELELLPSCSSVFDWIDNCNGWLDNWNKLNHKKIKFFLYSSLFFKFEIILSLGVLLFLQEDLSLFKMVIT